MKTINLKREAWLWVLLVLPFIYIAYVWNSLPDIVPIHFGTDGQPNGWSGKWGVLVIPGINVFVYLLMLFLPVIDPRKERYESYGSNFYKIRVLLTLFLFVFTCEWVYRNETGTMVMDIKWVSASAFLLFAILGNYFINIKPNWFIGIRTPWTLSNDTIWRKTHRLLGNMWFYGGIACLLLSLVINGAYISIVLVAFVISTALFSAGYSFWLYKQLPKA